MLPTKTRGGVAGILQLHDLLPRVERHVQPLRLKHPRHTLIPNTMIGIANLPVYGYDTECARILEELRRGVGLRRADAGEEWMRLQRHDLPEAYQSFRDGSGCDNEVLWFGWTYWHPTERGRRRRSTGSLTTSDHLSSFLCSDCASIQLGDMRLRPQQCDPGLERASTATARLSRWGEWVWNDYFHSLGAVASTAHGGPYDTLNDYLHGLYVKTPSGTTSHEDLLLSRPFAFIEPLRRTDAGVNSVATDLQCTDNELDALWSWAMKPFRGQTIWREFLRPVVTAGIQRLKRGRQEKPPEAAIGAIERTVKVLGIQVPHRHVAGYVVLQHLAYYREFMRSKCQYSLIVPCGRYLCTMMIGTRRPLASLEIIAWRAVALQLFSASTIEHFAAAEADRREWERVGPKIHLLSHGFTKAFATPLLNLCDRLQPPTHTQNGPQVDTHDMACFLRGFSRTWGGGAVADRNASGAPVWRRGLYGSARGRSRCTHFAAFCPYRTSTAVTDHSAVANTRLCSL